MKNIRNIYISFIVLISLLYSCQTNRVPRWVEEPPLDDELYVYIVGVGINSDKLFQSVLSQIYDRFNIEENKFIHKRIFDELELSSSLSVYDTTAPISVINKWNSPDKEYILVRITRSSYDSLFNLYSQRYPEMINYSNADERAGDLFADSGEEFKAFEKYIEALQVLLTSNDDFYLPAIDRLLSKLLFIINNIKYTDIKTFSSQFLGVPSNNLFSFKIDSSNSYAGFPVGIAFIQGWDTRDVSAIIPITNNVFEFLPPVQYSKGEFAITSKLWLDDYIANLNAWSKESPFFSYVNQTVDELIVAVDKSIISFTYTVLSSFHTASKIVSYGEPLVVEGIVRYGLEHEEIILPAVRYIKDESLKSYIRDINTFSDSVALYLILGSEITLERIPYEEGVFITTEGSFSVIELISESVIATRTVKSEYLASPGSENDIAYLDFGLKVGEALSDIKF